MNTKLEVIAKTLTTSTDYKRLTDCISELHDLCSSITNIKAGNIQDKDLFLNSGKAISPTKAAHCMLEIERTRRFVKGIYKAVLNLKQKFNNERINILYAGTGPYSTLVLPLTALFGSEEIALYMMDINPISLKSLKDLYKHLNLMSFVKDFIFADASVYKIPEGTNIHLIISETMQNALQKEPQVAIMQNLIPQLTAKGIFIPEEIRIDAVLTHSRQEQESFYINGNQPRRINLGTVYRIGLNELPYNRPCTIRIPHNIDQFTDLMLFTEIKVYEDERLTAYNCGLNMPFRIGKAEDVSGRSVVFEYLSGTFPGFKHTMLES